MLDNQGYLKLKADDDNDLKVFAAYLQDSLTVSDDIKYLEKNKTLPVPTFQIRRDLHWGGGKICSINFVSNFSP